MSPSIQLFNESRYKELMDGLECSEISFSKLGEDNDKYRIDSEFYQKKYIGAYNLLKNMKHSTIVQEYACLTDFHANGSYKDIAQNYELLDEENYAYMVRTTDLETKNYFENVKYISEYTYNYLAKSKVYGGEVLINKIGNPGRTFIMPKLNRPVSLGMNLFLLRMKKDAIIKEHVLWAYLNTDIGRNIIERNINGTVPLTIDKASIKSLFVPCFSEIFQEKIGILVNKGFELELESIEEYKGAEILLESIIGIKSEDLRRKTIVEKNFSESFIQTGRIDAEYYQEKYEYLLSRIEKFDLKNLGGKEGLVNITTSIEPGSDEYCETGIPFIRVSDVSKYGLSEPNIFLDKNSIPNITVLYPKKNTILFSKDGSVGIAYKLEEDKKIVTSSALLHLTVKNLDMVLPEYLTLVLNSLVVRLQAERDSSGALIQHWKKSEIENVVIPIIDRDSQQLITNKLMDSFAHRKKAMELFEKTKLAVENAILLGEKSGFEIIERAMDNY